MPAQNTSEKTPKKGVGSVVKNALEQGKTNEDVLAEVKIEFPESNTSLATISWYRNDMRKKEGSTIPTAREAEAAKNKAD